MKVEVELTQEQHNALKPLVALLVEADEAGEPGMIISQPWFEYSGNNTLHFWFLDHDEDDDERWANGYLIAAAPELLEACKAAMPIAMEFDDDAYFKLRDAVAKAKGER